MLCYKAAEVGGTSAAVELPDSRQSGGASFSWSKVKYSDIWPLSKNDHTVKITHSGILSAD